MVIHSKRRAKTWSGKGASCSGGRTTMSAAACPGKFSSIGREIGNNRVGEYPMMGERPDAVDADHFQRRLCRNDGDGGGVDRVHHIGSGNWHIENISLRG